MRRDRVAANDPFAENVSNPNSGSGKPRVAAEDPFAAATPAPTTTTPATSTTAATAFRPPPPVAALPPPPPSITAGSALFDPFLKPATKAHRGSSFMASSSASRYRNSNSNNSGTMSQSTSRAASTATATQWGDNNDVGGGGGATSAAPDFVLRVLQHSDSAAADRREQKQQRERQLLAMTAESIVQEWCDAFPSSSVADATGVAAVGVGVSFVRDRKLAAGLIRSPATTAQDDDDNNNVNGGDAASSVSSSPAPVAFGHAAAAAGFAASSSSSSSTSRQQQSAPAAMSIPFLLEGAPEVEWWDRPFVPAPSYGLGAVKQLPALGGPTATIVGPNNGAADAAAAPSSSGSIAATILGGSSLRKKNPTVSFPPCPEQGGLSNNTPLAIVTAVPRKVGWNPPDPTSARQAAFDAAVQHASKIKTREEINKERHERRLAAARERDEAAKQMRAQQHNFGLAEQLDGNNNNNNADAGQQQQAEEPHDRLRMRHLQTNRLLTALVDDPTVGDRVRAEVAARIQKSLDDGHRRHVEAKQHQVDHDFDVRRRHALTAPRIIAARVLGVTDERAVQRLKIECKGMFLRGVMMWISRKFLLAVLVGGVKAIHKAEALFERRAVDHKDLLKPGTNVSVVWGGLLSDFAFAKSFLIENSPFDRDGGFKKAAVTAPASNNNNNAAEAGDHRGKYESVPVVHCDSFELGKQWFGKHGLDWLWDVMVETPVRVKTDRLAL